jgi:hypothetical protein
MKNRQLASATLGALLLLGGCSALNSTAPNVGVPLGRTAIAAAKLASVTSESAPTVGASPRAVTVARHQLYITNDNYVEVYDARGSKQQPLYQIGDTESGWDFSGLALDQHGTLYAGRVYQPNNSQSLVWIVPKGATKATKTLHLNSGYPWGIVVDRGGTVYVSDESGVEVFPKGKTRPSRTLPMPTSGSEGVLVSYLALDSAGDLYVSYSGGTSGCNFGKVAEFLPGASSGSDLPANVGCAVAGIAIDRQGNLLAATGTNGGSEIGVFAPGASQPFRALAQHHNAFVVTINPDDSRLFFSDFGFPKVEEWTYPVGRRVHLVTNGLSDGIITGIAVN